MLSGVLSSLQALFFSLSLSLPCVSILCHLGCLYEECPMIVFADWEQVAGKGGVFKADCDWPLRSVCVYCELMCTLVFLGLQTHRQPVLTDGIYGKKFN